MPNGIFSFHKSLVTHNIAHNMNGYDGRRRLLSTGSLYFDIDKEEREAFNEINRDESFGELEWKLKRLRAEFKIKDNDVLFRKYQSRLQHRFFTILLMFNMIVNFIDCFWYFFYKFFYDNIFCGIFSFHKSLVTHNIAHNMNGYDGRRRLLSTGSLYFDIDKEEREAFNEINRDESFGELEWKLKRLRAEFKIKDNDVLFRKYQSRLQHRFFTILLMFNMIVNFIDCFWYFFYKTDFEFPFPAMLRLTALIVYISFLILAHHNEKWFRSEFARAIAGIAVLLAMIYAEYGGFIFTLTGDQSFKWKRLRPVYYLIICNELLLPFPSRVYSVVATVVIIALEITIVNRRAFLDHRRCVESKFKLTFEKDQQERLLGSCLPQHLMKKVKRDIRERFAQHMEQHDSTRQASISRPFSELYIEKYTDVTILYADIVNSMLLTQSLESPQDLVETLNELFGRFDTRAEANNCLRIKLLGDCYYCVSGIPVHDPNHALNSINMGIDMIDIIK
ncbi:unnamed protein product [Medioppia subpectinata]|uniref:adenylate cyclase n=1 Tax=Medioppia subpectinata TaxID=1979941 RepID=A0A7R9KRU3_9ACAR|nr:unnamed protein product [Medioppia subpectinata]CAG2107280.1 unnamed protein product [Medioppia subpectinata]